MSTDQVRIDPRAIEPFNCWWRTHARQATPPSNPEIVKAFAAGFKAGLQCGVDGAVSVLKGEKP